MAELADALDLGSNARKGVQVQILFSAPQSQPLEEKLVTPWSWKRHVRVAFRFSRPSVQRASIQLL